MRRLILLSLLLFSSLVNAQNYRGNIFGINYNSGASVPGSCTPNGRFFFKNTATTGWYQCIGGTYSILGSGAGSVASVALTVNSTSPSGIFTVTGSPVTTSGTLNFNLAGTSGGIPYFSDGTTLSSSAALTANTLVKGGGAGAAPTLSAATDDGTTFTIPGRIFSQSSTDATAGTFTNASYTLTLNPAATKTGGSNVLAVTNASTLTQAVSGRERGLIISMFSTNTQTTTRMEGLNVGTNPGGTGNYSEIRGIYSDTEPLTTAGTTASNYGIYVTTGQGAAGGAITNDYSIIVSNPTLSGALAHHYGLYFASGQTGGANNSDGWAIFEAGGDKNQLGLLFTTTNCAANGTAASPSVASCAAAPAGAFSCATNASGGTCTVNTTAVTATSQIFVTLVQDEGTRLSVTCNTGLVGTLTVFPTALVATKTAGVGFTISAPTFITNPTCFDYFIIN